LDSQDNCFKDRDLWLDTGTLDSIIKAAVEATYDLNDSSRRSMLRYRHLFYEGRPPADCLGFNGCFIAPDYFEDEVGLELSYNRMAVILTGNPDAIFFPSDMTPHDVEFCVTEKPPVNLDKIYLPTDQLTIIGYFSRDLREMLETALYKDGPGSLSGPAFGGRWSLKTAVSDEEIRSFVTIFRRLYMGKEPANFSKAVAVFTGALTSHPIAKWVQAIATEYQNAWQQPPDSVPMLGPHTLPFTRERLIDVYLYTQYAHQPDDKRTREFNECLAAVGGNRSSLTWLFLTEIWKAAIQIRNAGTVIADFFDRYCLAHNSSLSVLASIRTDHPGLGTMEKKAVLEARIIREKAEELAIVFWERAGRPDGGSAVFISSALEQLRIATGRVD